MTTITSSAPYSTATASISARTFSGEPTIERRPGRRSIMGSPAKVRAEVEAVAVEYGAEEVIVVTITHDHQARRRSYELLADAFALEPREVTMTPALAPPR